MGLGPKNIDYEKLTNEFIKDPSNENKSIKNPNYDYDIGYLAEASAVGAGFENFYNNDNIEKVIRYLSNEKLDTKFENGYQLEKNKTSDVNTSAGWFHFIIQQKRFNDLNGNTQTPFLST